MAPPGGAGTVTVTLFEEEEAAVSGRGELLGSDAEADPDAEAEGSCARMAGREKRRGR